MQHRRRKSPIETPRWIALWMLVGLTACAEGPAEGVLQARSEVAAENGIGAEPASAPADPYLEQRRRMVDRQIRARGIRDAAVLEAMRKVPRHRFVPPAIAPDAYRDSPLPIGHGQTISQPYIVAFMTELLELEPTDKVLEIGTGSGYQAAILGELAGEVYTIEIVEPLGKEARERLKELGYDNVHVRIGDGYKGWAEHAPYDKIIVTCAPDHVPEPLVDQLRSGGRMCIPVGPTWSNQELFVMAKAADGTLRKDSVLPVRFVPLTRDAEE